MDRIAVIGGTSESVFICKKLENKYDLLVFAATEDGKNIMHGIRCEVHTGRLGYDGFADAFGGIRCVVDASHPFAEELTKTVKSVCFDMNIPYLRYLRKKGTYNYDNIFYVSSKESAAEVLNHTGGRILFTTGAKTAAFYEKSVNSFDKRAVMRVMDSQLAHSECDALKCEIIYENPPFTAERNVDLIRKYDIEIMVSKDSGERGGVHEKADACKSCGIPLVLISAPEESGTESADEVLRFAERICGGKNVSCND